MRRLHLFEWEDLRGFPHAWRNYLTDMLQFSFTLGAHRAPVITNKLHQLLDTTGCNEMVDLCSGSSGAILWFREKLEEQRGSPVHVILTDKYPNLYSFRHFAERSDGRVRFHRDPVDAAAVPGDFPGVRTMLTAFHHFDREVARGVLADAVRHRRAIAVFEPSERTLRAILLVLFGGPLAVLLLTPFVRPFRWGRLLWTYLLPVVPLALVWDGVVSCLRSYTVAELSAITAGLAGDGYRWEVGRERLDGLPAAVTYVVGLPQHD
jgi:hypothetical protein